MGCIVESGREPPPLETVRCVRMDLVNQKSFAGRPVWSWNPPAKGQLPAFSLWPVENKVGLE